MKREYHNNEDYRGFKNPEFTFILCVFVIFSFIFIKGFIDYGGFSNIAFYLGYLILLQPFLLAFWLSKRLYVTTIVVTSDQLELVLYKNNKTIIIPQNCFHIFSAVPNLDVEKEVVFTKNYYYTLFSSKYGFLSLNDMMFPDDYDEIIKVLIKSK